MNGLWCNGGWVTSTKLLARTQPRPSRIRICAFSTAYWICDQTMDIREKISLVFIFRTLKFLFKTLFPSRNINSVVFIFLLKYSLKYNLDLTK